MFVALLALSFSAFQGERAVRTEVVTPIHIENFSQGGQAHNRKQDGNPRMGGGNLVFDGASDGNRQIDPQIAVGGGYVLNGTNLGLLLFDKEGHYVDGIAQSALIDGIDPKLFFDPNNRVFGFDVWKYYDKEKLKPVNFSISETADPRGPWNRYSISETAEVDGGGIGFSRKWIGYSFPGGSENTFVMKMADVKAGKPATVYHFAGDLGQPVFTQDKTDDLRFVQFTDTEIVITMVGDGPKDEPVVKSVIKSPHNFRYFGWPPQSPMKGTDKRTASGDRNPKNLVVQSGFLWFSHTVNVNGRAGVEWHQVSLHGDFIQNGLLGDPVNSFIQTTLAVNKRNDVLVGFQETGPDMFISARAAWRRANAKPGFLGPIIHFSEGIAATEGGAWGDYSGSVIDGDNLIDLWTIQSVANATGRGSTAIMRVKL